MAGRHKLTPEIDDNTVVERAQLAESATETVEEVFGMLGWRLKDLPKFAAFPEPLGARVELDRWRLSKMNST